VRGGKLTSFLLLGLLTSCLSIQKKADFEKSLRGWIGKPIADFRERDLDLIRTGTSPQGLKVYIFEFQGWQRGIGQPGSAAIGASQPGWAPSGGAVYCRIVLEVNQSGTIVSSRYEGNGCW